MSFFSKVASVANTAASVTMKASNMAYNTANKAYSDITAHPTTVKCCTEDCVAVLDIPETVWVWQCSMGHENTDDKCTQCQAAKPAGDPPEIICQVCEKSTPVPLTVASKYAQTAVKGAKQAAVATADYTKQTYKELSAHPETIPCSNEECDTLLAVPASLWESSECAPGGQPVNPLIACPVCEAHTVVPSTVASVKMTTAATTTKTVAMSTAAAAKKQYEHLVAKPDQFNCQNCNTKLVVPDATPWQCQKIGCAVDNEPTAEVCVQCKQRNKSKVLCGVCNKVTGIPASNLLNVATKTKLSTVQAYDSAKKTAAFVSEHKEDIQAAGQFAKENPELTKAAVNASKQVPK